MQWHESKTDKQIIFITAGGIVAGIAGFFFCLMIYPWEKPDPPFKLRLVSPNGRNIVELTEHIDVTPFPLRHFAKLAETGDFVTFNLSQEGRSTVINAGLWGGDGFPDRFLGRYPKYFWQSESVLRFLARYPPTIPQQAEIIIYNDSDRDIDYVRTSADDMFLAISLPSKSSLTLRTVFSAYEDSTNSIECVWKFAGDDTEHSGFDTFTTGGMTGYVGHYSVVIYGIGARVSSTDHKVFNGS